MLFNVIFNLMEAMIVYIITHIHAPSWPARAHRLFRHPVNYVRKLQAVRVKLDRKSLKKKKERIWLIFKIRRLTNAIMA